MRSPVLVVLLVLCCAVELTLTAADAGLIGTRLWRSVAYQNGAFWAGLLHNWRPNFPLQPWTMFGTYAFLHSDIWHLLGNMISLIFLGAVALRRVGQGAFVLIYAVSALGGAVAFALLSQNPSPMVGASGALFGLAGAWQYWEWRDLGKEDLSRWPVVRVVLVLAVLNVLMWLLLDGALAWETHLGGFVFGWGIAYLLD